MNDTERMRNALNNVKIADVVPFEAKGLSDVFSVAKLQAVALAEIAIQMSRANDLKEMQLRNEIPA